MNKTAKKNRSKKSQVLAAIIFLWPTLLFPHTSFADDDHDSPSGDDHASPDYNDEWEEHNAGYDDALEAVQKGSVLPLSKIKQKVTSRWSGAIVNISIKRRGSVLHYEFKILRPSGRLTEVEVNAANGAIVEVENE